MTYPAPSYLEVPLDKYELGAYRFGTWIRGRFLPVMHLGDDAMGLPGTKVSALGDGEVVWSQMRPGSKEKKNWGGLVVIGHTHKKSQETFYSLYGHITEIQVKAGDKVHLGQKLGVIAPGQSPDNGYWKLPHLHFSIYVGAWHEQVLPGWWRIWQRRTWPWHWRNPQKFIKKYNLDNFR